jgi:hypothetical protein
VALWYSVEALCPSCQSWQRTGATTTVENFEEPAPRGLGNMCLLACGHRVDISVHELRVGPEATKR